MKKIIFTLSFLAFLGLSTLHAQVKVGNNPTSIDASAAFEVESTNKGLLPPRMETADRDGIASPVEGLTIYNTDNNCLEFFNGTAWISACDASIASGACQGEPASFTFEGLEYKPVESDGKCWLDRNLGASRVATTSDDFQAYGSLYQWGRGNDGHQLIIWTESSTSTTNNTVSNTTPGPVSAGTEGDNFITVNAPPNDWLSPQDDNRWGNPNDDDKGPEDPCPPGYRVPTQAEWEAERLSWAPNNDATEAFASPLKLPMPGYRWNATNALVEVGSQGFYWSSTVSGTDAWRLFFSNSTANVREILRSFGFSVRCIKD